MSAFARVLQAQRFKLSAAITMAAMTLAASPHAAAETVLTVSQWVPPTHPVAEVMTHWAAEVQKATDGRVRLNQLPQPVTNPPGHFNAVRDGLADVAFTVVGYTPGRFRLSEIAELPLTGDSAESNSAAYWRVAHQHPAIIGEFRDVKVLALFTHGPGTVYTTKAEVKTQADLQKLKFRVGGGVVHEVGRALGANVTIKPATETYELLANGVMDGAWLPIESLATYKLENLVRHITTFPGGLYNSTFIVLMNRKAWDRLDAADQKAIDALSGEALSRASGRAFDERDRQGEKLARSSGVTVTPASPALVGEVEARIAPLEKRWTDLAKSRGIDNPEQVLRDYRIEARKSP